MPTVTRTFRVFVSSTFEDLIAERDILQAEVFPKLEKFCLEKGARFQAIDLRWGVREEAGIDHRTMDICLREIERCKKTGIKPNFIVLLGDRYGWQPVPARIRKEEFDAVVAHASESTFVKSWYQLDENAVPHEYLLRPRGDSYEEWKPIEVKLRTVLFDAARTAGLSADDLIKYHASATHQEILAGLGKTEEDRRHVFAFSREPGLNPFHELLAGLPIQEFSPAAVEAALKKTIDSEVTGFASIKPLQQEKDAHDRFAVERSKHFVGRTTVLDGIKGYIIDGGAQPLIVHGESGSGKSSILARASSDHECIRRFIGATPTSSSGLTLLQSLCEEIGERYSQTAAVPAIFDELTVMFHDRLRLATAERPLILYIDALDQLGAQDSAASMNWFPRELSPHCRVVFSTTDIPSVLSGAQLIEVKAFSVHEAETSLSLWLGDAKRALQHDQRAKLLASFHQNGLPLYLKLAFEEARLWRSFDSLDACVLGDGLPGIIDCLFARLSDPKNHGEVLVKHAFGYLTAARYGLTEDEMLSVLTRDKEVWCAVVGNDERRRYDPPEARLPVAAWSRLYLDLEPYLTERAVPGAVTVSFYHRQLGERVETTAFHHEGLVKHFSEQSNWLALQVPNQRRITVLVSQQVGAGLLDDVERVLTDLDFVSAKCAAEQVLDLQEDYRMAIAALPEAQVVLQREDRLQAELDRWSQSLVEWARQSRLPKPAEVISSVEWATEEQIAANNRKILETPTRFDRLMAFSSFIGKELYPLLEHGKQRGFVFQHAFNSAPTGPVHDSAGASVGTLGTPMLLRRWPTDARFYAKPALLRTLKGHTEYVTSVCVTANGRRAVSTSDDQTLRVWELETGVCLRVVKGWGAIITPNGRLAISPAGYYKTNVWNLETGVCERVLEGETVDGGTVTPDGRLAVLQCSRPDGRGGFVYTIQRWNLETGTCERVVDQTSLVHCLDATIDGRLAISVVGDFKLRLWDLDTGRCLQVLEGHDSRPDRVSLTADGRRAISTSSRDHTVRVWNLAKGTCERVFEGKGFNSVTPDGRRAVSSGEMRAWDLETGNQTGSYRRGLPWGKDDRTASVSLTPDGRRAVSAFGHDLLVWNLESGEMPQRSKHWHASSVTRVGVTSDRQRGVTIANDYSVREWDLKSAECLRAWEQMRGSVDVKDAPLGTLHASAETDRVSVRNSSGPLATVVLDSFVSASTWIEPSNTLIVGAMSGEVLLFQASGLPLQRSGLLASTGHPGADAKQAQRLNLEYQKDKRHWETLPWWQRIATKKPEPPTGI